MLFDNGQTEHLTALVMSTVRFLWVSIISYLLNADVPPLTISGIEQQRHM